MSDAQIRRPGRRPIYPDQNMEKFGIALHPEQRNRLNAFAAGRGTNLSALVRDIITQWEQATFPSAV